MPLWRKQPWPDDPPKGNGTTGNNKTGITLPIVDINPPKTPEQAYKDSFDLYNKNLYYQNLYKQYDKTYIEEENNPYVKRYYNAAKNTYDNPNRTEQSMNNVFKLYQESEPIRKYFNKQREELDKKIGSYSMNSHDMYSYDAKTGKTIYGIEDIYNAGRLSPLRAKGSMGRNLIYKADQPGGYKSGHFNNKGIEPTELMFVWGNSDGLNYIPWYQKPTGNGLVPQLSKVPIIKPELQSSYIKFRPPTPLPEGNVELGNTGYTTIGVKKKPDGTRFIYDRTGKTDKTVTIDDNRIGFEYYIKKLYE